MTDKSPRIPTDKLTPGVSAGGALENAIAESSASLMGMSLSANPVEGDSLASTRSRLFAGVAGRGRVRATIADAGQKTNTRPAPTGARACRRGTVARVVAVGC